jgi:hypothetical protein
LMNFGKPIFAEKKRRSTRLPCRGRELAQFVSPVGT